MAVLLRPGSGPSRLILLAANGSLLQSSILDQFVYEIAFWGDTLVGCSWNRLFSVEQTPAQHVSVPLRLDYPFFLLPQPAGDLTVIDALRDRLFSVHGGVFAATKRPDVPELSERTQELANRGATSIVDASVDLDGNYYVLLQNFVAANGSRVLKLDKTSKKIGVVEFPYVNRENSSNHVHPITVRANGGLVYLASLGYNKIRVAQF